MYYLDYWYVLFVKTGREKQAAEDIRKAFNEGEIKPFIPYGERFFKKEKQKHPMFPGYLFIETAIPNEEFQSRSLKFIWRSKNITKLLTYSDSDQAAVSDEERKMLQSLWVNKNRGIDASKGIIEGDRVIITEGSLVGMETMIKKIDRHKMRAEVEVPFFGKPNIVAVGLDIIRKVS